MNERTLKVLEFHKIVQLLTEETATLVGRNRAGKIKPLQDLQEVEHLQMETDQALFILRLDKTVPFSHVEDVSGSLMRAEIGSQLTAKELIDIAQVMYSGRQLKNFIEDLEEPVTLLKAIVEKIYPYRELERQIRVKIDEYGEVVDDASYKLKSIRQSIHQIEGSIRERLHNLTKTKSKMLSDTIITRRNDRYVLPVKHEYKGAIGGIVHDESASGQTLFMEPKAIIELNNNLQQKRIQEKQEVAVILSSLTQEVSGHSRALIHHLKLIAELDFIFARARLALKMKASKPEINEMGIIDLKNMRHPLIPLDEVVASDLRLGDDHQAIVITGPNTGGKTVTLKTVGLIVLMTQSGLQIPALDGGRISFYQNVFADIGDEQSIEQNLSTFSSHMTNIISMLAAVDNQTLILFDELGAGTDPQEGAALAMAILDDVITKGASVIATTHYPELKAYGYNRPSVMNASVEFDVESLKPTYRLQMGVPGRSNAFEISTRLGIQDAIIQKAKSYIGVDSKNVENMIMALENTKKSVEAEHEAMQTQVKASDELYQSLQEAWRELNEKQDALYKKAEEKAEKALRRAREEAELIIDEVRSMRDHAKFKEHEWIDAKKMIEDAQPKLVKAKEKSSPKNKRPLRVGDDVKLHSLDQNGSIVEMKSDKEAIVQVGMMKVTAKINDLELLDKKPEEKQEAVSHTIRNNGAAAVTTELDLRGERYDDALLKLEQYIDEAIMQNYHQARIIHGKGTGALRKGVEKYLKKHPQIEDYHLGHQNEGGSGVTVIELK